MSDVGHTGNRRSGLGAAAAVLVTAAIAVWLATSIGAAQTYSFRVFFPLAQPETIRSSPEKPLIEPVVRHEGIRLGGSGLGVPDTRQPAMTVLDDSAYVIALGDSGDELVTVSASGDEPPRRYPLAYDASAVRRVGDRLAVLGPGGETEGPDPLVARLYDTSRDTAPVLIGQTSIGRFMSLAASAGTDLYVAGADEVRMIDMADPAAMSIRSRVDIWSRPNDIGPSVNATAYLGWDNHVYVFDASRDDGRLDRIRTSFERLRALRVLPDNGYLVSFDRVFVESGLIDGRLIVHDVSDPQAPRNVSELMVPAVFDWDRGLIRDFGPMFFDLTGDILLIAAHELVAIDVSDPENPKIVSRHVLPDRALGIGRSGNTVFVAEEGGTLALFRLPLE